jgi:hypothetical protein
LSNRLNPTITPPHTRRVAQSDSESRSTQLKDSRALTQAYGRPEDQEPTGEENGPATREPTGAATRQSSNAVDHLRLQLICWRALVSESKGFPV